MVATPYNPTGEYQPESTLVLPALFAWPPRPLAALRYLLFGMLFPWGYLYTGMAFVSWHDGSRESLQNQKQRLRKQRRQDARD